MPARFGWHIGSGSHVRRRFLCGLTSVLLALGFTSIALVTQSAHADSPPPGVSPVVQRTSSQATADALPTVQIDGVVWEQAIAGSTVWAGGSFANARPAGAAPGTNQTTRNNLLAYNINTGALITSINPNMNGQVKAVAVSPDGSTVYVGGSFTTANGVTRNRIAAFNATTGALLSNFAPSVDSTVNAIAVTSTTVYVGGGFSKSSGTPRANLAAFNASNGALTSWNPGTNREVEALVVTPDGQKVVVGGSFSSLAGNTGALGIGAVDTATGLPVTWNISSKISNYGPSAAILSLTTDASGNVYGTGYTYGPGWLEGAFSANQTNGDVNWIEDCHGDTYSVAANSNQVFTVSHAHYCGNIGGFPQTSPTWTFHRTMSFTKNATGTVQHDPYGYHDWYGNPSPSIIDWFPELAAGSYTGKTQAAWTVTANDQYVLEGGEFPTVNGVGQQGLVRFAVPSSAPNKQGPQLSGNQWQASYRSLAAGAVRIAFPSNWDPDDLTLTYKIYRDTTNSPPVYTTTGNSTSWNMPGLGYIDTGLAPGSTHQYKIVATDPDGNTASTNWTSVTVSSTGTLSTYSKDVLNDGAQNYWPLSESSGTTAYDYAGFSDMTEYNGVTQGAPGSIAGDPSTASTFNGSNQWAATNTKIAGPNTFSIEAWFKTTSTSGGKIVGFGDQNTTTSGNYDRHVYMDPQGRVWFGVYNNGSYTVNTSKSYNDGQWHYVVGTMSASGLVLYVDGKQIGTNGGTSVGQNYSGYWRIGGDSPWNGNPYFNGTIDDVAIYPTALPTTTVRQHFVDAGGSLPGSTPPADAYGKAVYNTGPQFYYRMDDTTGTGATDVSGNGNNGVYYGSETRGVSSPVTGSNGVAVTFPGVKTADLATADPVSNPTTYSEELWFNTQTTSGGKLIGFGSSPNGDSGSYDRHVYMTNSGQLVFGTYTGQINTVTSANSYNDGKWHYLVATQGSGGMNLYVDDQLVGTNPQTSAQSYNGYWRVGGDNLNSWPNQPSSGYFNGTIDEVAIYSGVLSAAQIDAHYHASPVAPAPPVAAFTATPSNLSVAVDASASTGSITSYAWDFGDGGTASGVVTNHTYAQPGTYTVTLTVTTGDGQVATATHSVTATKPNQPPTASFTSSANGLAASFDGTGSSDPDGTIASYAWDYGDGSTGTGATSTHNYASSGTYTVTLTVTDNGNLTGTTTNTITVTAPNVPPVAAFTPTSNDLTVNVDGSASNDPDGTIASYAWNFGDGGSATGVTASHTYASAGTYSVKLTVTDNQGASTSVTQSVTVSAANVPPVARFTSTTNGLTANLDASTSSDTDGTIASYAWNFGDGTTGTGVTESHAYTSAGTYTVTLTVTDNSNATNSTTGQVTVSGPTVVAADTFNRTVTNGWGTADTGGAWTLTGSASRFGVAGGSGTMTLTGAGQTATAMLNSVAQSDTDMVVDLSPNVVSTGGGTYVTLIVRHVGTTDYRVTLLLLPNGVVHISLSKVVNGVSTSFGEKNVTGLTYAAGDVLKLRLTAITTNGTTALSSTVWKAGTTEPTTAQATASDSTAALQAAGSVGISTYVSGAATTVPVKITYDNLSVTQS